jgi:TolB protein
VIGAEIVLAARLAISLGLGVMAPGHGPSPSAPCRTVAVPQADRSTAPGSPSASLSADGRFLAFVSYARLLPADGNDSSDIYVFDFQTGVLTIESLLPDGSPANGDSLRPRLSGDGRYLVFEAVGRLVSASLDELRPETLLRDRALGATRILVVTGGGALGNRPSSDAAISADGRVVAFTSGATDLVPEADGNGPTTDVYVLVIATGAMARASLDTAGRQPRQGASHSPTLSDDGRYVAFTSEADFDVDDATASAERLRRSRKAAGRRTNVFVRDLERGITRRVSRREDGRVPNGASYAPAISADGRVVAFVSQATNLVRGDSNRAADVYLHDLVASTTMLVSRTMRGRSANGSSSRPALSGDGRVVVFQSDASDLVCARDCGRSDVDTNLVADVFAYDRERDAIRRLSADAGTGWPEPSRLPIVDVHGTTVAFASRRPIDGRDGGNDFDLFVQHDCASAGPVPARPHRTR